MLSFSGGGGARGQAVELRQEGEDQGGDGAEELLVVTEENAQCFRYGEDELPVRELEEELLIEVFGEQESAFLGAGGAKAVQLPAQGIEPFTGKGTKVFETAFGIRALNATEYRGRGYERCPWCSRRRFQTSPPRGRSVSGGTFRSPWRRGCRRRGRNPGGDRGRYG